jgi:hypothetical protein
VHYLWKRNKKEFVELKFIVTSFQSLYGQAFQRTSSETQYRRAFQPIVVSFASDFYEVVFRLILTQRGLEQVIAIVKNSKKILSDSKSRYICSS